MVNTKRIILLLFLLFIYIGTVTGGGGETTTDYTYYDVTTYQDIAYAEEDGHFDIQFSDDYKGYCFEYGEEEATKGDKFYVEQTDYILSTKGQDVSNYLKLYFVDYYNETQKDKIVTQHTIWHFTDDFDGWRVNKTLVNDIKTTSEFKKIQDDGVKEWNATHDMIYSFRSLISPFEEHQNFFGYKINFKERNSTSEDIECNNTTIINNYTNITNNYHNNTTNYITNNTNNTSNTINNYFNTNITLNQNNYTNYTNNQQLTQNTSNKTITIIHILIYKILQPNPYHITEPVTIQKPTIIHLQDYKTGINPLPVLLLTIIIITCAIYSIKK